MWRLSPNSRKLIVCKLASSDYQSVRSICSEMSLKVKDSIETRYLLYKVGVRNRDIELGKDIKCVEIVWLTPKATECLESIAKGSSSDATVLYACVLEAQETDQQDQAIMALQAVLKKYHYCVPPGVHLPALLRYAAS